VVAGGRYELYSNYALQIQAVAASLVATRWARPQHRPILSEGTPWRSVSLARASRYRAVPELET